MRKIFLGLALFSSMSAFANTFELPVVKVKNALLSYTEYTILGTQENAVNYCKIRGFSSAESFESKVTIWRGVPGTHSMVWGLPADASLTYNGLSDAEAHLEFQKINRNGYGGNIEIRKINCTMEPVGVDQVKEIRAKGVDTP
jgi:hypothetical protein